MGYIILVLSIVSSCIGVYLGMVMKKKSSIAGLLKNNVVKTIKVLFILSIVILVIDIVIILLKSSAIVSVLFSLVTILSMVALVIVTYVALILIKGYGEITESTNEGNVTEDYIKEDE